MNTPQILIVDFGCQYTTVIARTLAELGFRSDIVSPKKVTQYLAGNTPKVIILSGGDASVYDEGAPTIDPSILSGQYYVLGICYGMQLIAYLNNPTLVSKGDDSTKGYGPVVVTHYEESPLFANVPKELSVWASHGDVVRVPENFVM